MKIYISATYRDLEQHRRAVAVVLRRMGHQVVGMEEYVAEGVRPLDRCLQDVRDCDIYVGILAWRYGSIPKTDGGGVELPKGTTLRKTSITEFEFRQADDSDKPILFFVLDPDAAWPSTSFDAVTGEGDRGRAIATLRREVAERFQVDFFRSPDDLASLVSSAVYRVEMSRQMTIDSGSIEAKLNPNFRHSGNVDDSSVIQIADVVAGAQDVQALKVAIGRGASWWLTRLYLLASLTADLTSVGIVVFVGDDETFVGVADPRIVQDRLGRDDARLKKYATAVARQRRPAADIRAEVHRRASIWRATMSDESGEPTFVTPSVLERALGPYLMTRGVESVADQNASLQMQRLIDWPMRFVPIVEARKFIRVVDKQALTEQVARLFVREQVSRALSTVR